MVNEQVQNKGQYSPNGAYPQELPDYWRFSDGTLRTDLPELTDEELAALGWFGPIQMPPTPGTSYFTHSYEWNSETLSFDATELDEFGKKRRVNYHSNIVGNVSGGASFTGIVTASSFSGNLTGTASTATASATAYGLTGSPNITVGNIVGTALTLSGDLTVNGTQTIINTQVLDVADKNIGIGSTSSPSDTLADGAGITIYGTTNKTITWENDTGCFEYNQPNKFRGVVETVAVGSTYDLGAGNVILELDVRNATTYTHT
jgi:hypothetical protein